VNLKISKEALTAQGVQENLFCHFPIGFHKWFTALCGDATVN